MSQWPTEVYTQKLTMSTGGVEYTFQKATMLDKDFVLSCWDEAKPISTFADIMTESQYYDLVIQQSVNLTAPGTLPIPFETRNANILRADGVRVGYMQGRWRRLESAEDDNIISDKVFTHVHKDFRGKGYYKIMTGFATYNAFVLYGAPKSGYTILDTSIPAKKLHTDLDATYKGSEPTSYYGEIHHLETSETNWKPYRESRGWEYVRTSEMIPITDSRWATPAITLDSGTRKWNTI